ncbi:MAG: hypothetical protein C4534_05850 [Gaiellales bacterium]|nr:MAG: hypothetical protein C4534_05850 [Gaiellales bacterium]
MKAGKPVVSTMTRRPSFRVGAILRVTLLALAFLLFWAGSAYAAEQGDVGASGTEEAVAAVADSAADETVDEVAATANAAPAGEEAAAGTEAAAQTQEPDAESAAAPVDETAAVEAPLSNGDGEAATAAGDEACCGDELQALAEDCEELEAILELICLKGDGNVFWESKADYDAGLLSLRYRLRNTSSDTSANNLRVVSATANNGVKIHTALPLSLGSLDPGDWLYFLLKWQVPKGVTNFVTDISICGDCEEFCADCPPPCQGDECEPVCEGDECEPACEGDECEPKPVCEGEGCNPPVDDEGQRPAVQPDAATPLQASALPNTGMDATLPLALGLGLLMLGGLMPALRYARQRKR